MTIRRPRTGWLAALLILPMLFGGCTYYQVAPGTYGTAPAVSFDRSWRAVVGAFDDQGVRITYEDRASGVLEGRRDGIRVYASVRNQSDGSVRVEFSTTGAKERDPRLVHRISRDYDRRMGR